jgi:1D-myo-inositol 3-kinase
LNEHQPRDFIVVGHVCQDLMPDGSLNLGGSVSYATTTADRMGYRVGVVTSAGADLDVGHALPAAEVVCRPSAATTLFENIYLNGGRKQFVHERADTITCAEIPPLWRQAPMAYLGSIDQEIDESVFHCFADDVLIGVMPQGFFRKWDDRGEIYFAPWEPARDVLRRINVLVISELDVPDPDQLVRDWGRFVDIIAVTRADRGASVYRGGESCHFPARTAQQVDPTGAGDVFAAAFLIRFSETGDPCQAAAFANVVASFSIEQPGLAGIPLRSRVAAYMKTAQEGPAASYG